MNTFQIGNIVYCHTTMKSLTGNAIWFTKDKTYKIIGVIDDEYVNGCIRMIDDEEDENDIYIERYNNNFMTLKEFRKMKLEKLKSL